MRPFAPLAFASLVAASGTAHAKTINVTPSDGHAAIEAAQPGDEVVVAAGVYKFRLYLSAQGTAAQPIVIRAADPNDRPVWDLSGQNVEAWPGSYTGGDKGRGCWQVTGAHYTISGIEFKSCRTGSGNASGIRAQGAQDLTVRDILVSDSDIGFSGNGTNVALEFSELFGNGRVSNPPQHNIYIYGGSFALRHSYIHDSVGGQNLHIRAADSVIEYNWIARAANYEADMMTGKTTAHKMMFRGNVVVGHANPDNGGKLFQLLNDTGTGGVSMDLTLLHNTFVVEASTNPVVVAVGNNTLASASVTAVNNVVVGTDKAFRVANAGTANYTLSGNNNWFETGADVGALTASVFGSDPGFTNAGSLDFTLASGSAAIGAADTSITGGPDREYFENESNPMMFRWRTAANDLGAFESTTTGNGYGPYDDPTKPPTGGGGGGAGGDSGVGGDSGSGGSSAYGGSTSGSLGDDVDDGSGCGCRVVNSEPSSGTLAWFGLAALALSRRRRARPRV